MPVTLLRRFIVICALFALVPGVQRAGFARAQVDDSHRYFLPVITAPGQPEWIGPYGGSVIALAAAPAQPAVVYAGTGQAGVFRSGDYGITWTAASQGLGNLFIDSLAVHPKNSQIVYAGTHGSGVYRTLDGGRSWQAVNNGIAPRTIVYSLAVNPGNPNLIYAGTRIQGTYYHGVMYKSTDGGASWTSVLEYADDWVYSIAVSPSAPNVVAAAVHTRGPLISQDYGSAGSWHASVPPDGLTSYEQGRWRKGRAVAFYPRSASLRLYYGAWHDGFFSVNPSGLTSGWVMSMGTGLSHIYPNGISIDPSAPDTAYFAAYIGGSTPAGDLPGGVYRSDNGGNNWRLTGLSDRYVYSVAALGANTVLSGTYADGLYRSADGGNTWKLSVTGLTNSMVTGVVAVEGAVLYASTTTGGGVWKSTDGGSTWAVFDAGLGDTRINGLVQHPADPNILYALTSKAGLRRIDLRSGGWTQATVIAYEDEQTGPRPFSPEIRLNSPILADGAADLVAGEMVSPNMVMLNAISKPVLALRFAPSNPSVAYLGTENGGVYRSSDGGATWQPAGLAGITTRSLWVDPHNPDLVYAAGGTLRTTSNGGAIWTSLPSPDAGITANSVAARNGESGVYAGTDAGVYRWDGQAWSRAGLDGIPVTALEARAGLSGAIYAATASGAYVLLPGSSEWALLNEALNGVSIQSISFVSCGRGALFIGTAGRGTLKLPSAP